MTDLKAQLEAKLKIAAHTRQMPFSGMLLASVPDVDAHEMTTEEFLVALAEWLAAYRAVIVTQSNEFTRQAARLRQLEDQRDVVRSFFGTLDGDDR